MSEERFEYVLGLDTKAVDTGLAQMDAKLSKGTAGIQRMDGAFKNIDNATGPMVQKAFRAMGQGAVANIIGPFGDIAKLVGKGGPVAIGLGLAAAGFMSIKKTMDESKQASDSWKESTKDLGDRMVKTRQDAVDPLRQSVKDLETELRNYGKTARTIKVDEAALAVEMMKTREEAARRTAESIKLRNADAANELEVKQKLDAAMNRGPSGATKDLADQVATARAAEANARKAADASRVAIVEAEKNLAKLRDVAEDLELRDLMERGKKMAEEEAKQKLAAAKKLAEQRVKDKQNELARLEKLEQQYRDEMEESEERQMMWMARQKEDAQRAAWKQREKAMLEEKALLERAAQEELRIEREKAEKLKQEREMISRDFSVHVGTMAALSESLVSDLVSGQEHAFETFALGVMRQAGQALVSYGTQLAGSAFMQGLLGNVPQAAAQGAGAAALIGAGVGLGGTAVGLGELLAGGGRGSSPVAPERGLGPVRMSGRDGGGGTNISVTYAGVSGPTADQGAAAVVQAQARARERQLEPGPSWT